MPDIVMTVKPRHIGNMFSGIKSYELRKTYPIKAPVDRVWICKSGSGGRIVASFRIGIIRNMTDDDDVTIAELSAIKPDEVKKYRKNNGILYGWKIEDFRYFDVDGKAKDISDFGLTRPPQSWCYTKEAGL